jgi:hypothetical protein
MTASAVDLSRVDEVLVLVTLGTAGDGEPTEAFLATLDMPPGQAFDDRAILELLAPLPALMGEDVVWSAQTGRTLAGTGPQATRATAQFRLDLVTAQPPYAPTTDDVEATDLRPRLEPLLRQAVAMAPQPTRRIPHEEAIAGALRTVALVWTTAPSPLRVSDEEHHAAPEHWTIGLVDPQLTRYEVRLGVVDGDPRTVHLRRHHAAEVADSVGVSG